MRRIYLLLATLPLLLSGCGALLHTDYTRPQTTIPAAWSTDANGTENTAATATTTKTTTDVADWPAGFSDPELEQLVQKALRRNNDLAAATLRVRQAQIKAGLAFDDMLPDLSATAGTDSQKSTARGDWSLDYSASLGVSYEADLWGKASSAHDAAEWEAVATAEDRAAAALSLVGTTMKLYWQIAYRNVRLGLSESNIESARQTLELMVVQERYGAASELEVNEARQNLASLRIARQTLLQERQENLNALAVLFDMPPGQTLTNPQELTDDMPGIPAGLPAELLGRRPDLRAAELRLRGFLASTDAARAEFYPSFSLTGSLGVSASETLAYIGENPLLAVASSIAMPFLNWNNLQLNLEASKAEYEEAVVNFRQTLYEAMVEVENALSASRTLAEKGKRLKESLDAASTVERIYEVRYKAGSGTFKDWLDAQDTRRTAEQSLAENTFDRLTNFVTLYQALGGQPAQPALQAEDS